MSFQGHVADITLKATETFLRYAKALPADKLDWKPAPESRSALSMLQEVAQDPRDLAKLFSGQEVPGSGTEEYLDRLQRERAEWTTLLECERVLEFNLSLLTKALRAFPSERLNEAVTEPWGYETTYLELMMYQYWNTVWHTGQIAYIQTLLGDRQSY